MSTKTVVANNNLGFMSALFLIFMTLKLTGHITWSWWWVTLPLWWWAVLVGVIIVIPVAISVIGLIVMSIISVVTVVTDLFEVMRDKVLKRHE